MSLPRVCLHRKCEIKTSLSKCASQTLLQRSLSLSVLVVLENTFGLGNSDHHSDAVIFMSSIKCEISPQGPFFVEKKASSPSTGIASIWGIHVRLLTIPLLSSSLIAECGQIHRMDRGSTWVHSRFLLSSLGLDEEGNFAKCIWKNTQKVINFSTNLWHHLFNMHPQNWPGMLIVVKNLTGLKGINRQSEAGTNTSESLFLIKHIKIK